MSALIEREVAAIEVKDGKAYLPFDRDDLYWLYDKIPASDNYRDIVLKVILKLESDGEETL